MFHTAIDSILIGCAFALYQEQIRRWLAANRWAFPTAMLFVFLISPIIASVLRPADPGGPGTPHSWCPPLGFIFVSPFSGFYGQHFLRSLPLAAAVPHYLEHHL